MGATTIWERWNSMKADGTFDESGMNSFNHYTYGSIGSWMYQKLGGINIVEPGYKKSLIAPMPIKGITHADVRIKTVYGELKSRWECKDGKFIVDIKIPCNTTAVVRLPDKNEEITVGSGTYHYEYPTDLNLGYERYSKDSTLRELFDNPAAMKTIKKHAPEIPENPMIGFALNQCISQLTATLSPEIIQLLEIAIKVANDNENPK